MPRGRPLNHDDRIARLIADLRKALIAREAARIEGVVAQHINDLVAGIQRGVEIGGARQVSMGTASTTTEAPAVTRKRGRKPRSAASRKLQAARMKAYWAKRKAKEGKGKGGKDK